VRHRAGAQQAQRAQLAIEAKVATTVQRAADQTAVFVDVATPTRGADNVSTASRSDDVAVGQTDKGMAEETSGAEGGKEDARLLRRTRTGNLGGAVDTTPTRSDEGRRIAKGYEPRSLALPPRTGPFTSPPPLPRQGGGRNSERHGSNGFAKEQAPFGPQPPSMSPTNSLHEAGANERHGGGPADEQTCAAQQPSFAAPTPIATLPQRHLQAQWQHAPPTSLQSVALGCATLAVGSCYLSPTSVYRCRLGAQRREAGAVPIGMLPSEPVPMKMLPSEPSPSIRKLRYVYKVQLLTAALGSPPIVPQWLARPTPTVVAQD
jgi:hypothetical protein